MRETTVRPTRTHDARRRGTGEREAGERAAVPRRRARSARVAGIVAVLPALLLAAACSSGPHSSKSADTDGSGGTPSGTRSASASLAGRAPLTKAQLTTALVTDKDVPGWAVRVSQTDDSADDSTLTADKPDCQPLADVTSSKPRIHRMAFVGAAFAKATTKAQPDAINQMLVASHAPGDAKKVIDSVKDALGTCTSFTAVDNTGAKTPFAISQGPAVPAGDEAVSYVMTDTSDKKTGAALVTVVQTGDTVAAYLSVKAAGGAGVLPIEVVRKENDKLKAALAAR